MPISLAYDLRKNDAMRITVIGGSQGTGAAFVELARTAGHQLTVVSRRELPSSPDSTVRGDARDSAVASAAVAGADAVVVTVGGARGVRRQRTAVTRAVVHAMQEHGVRRLIVQSALGAHGSAVQLPRPFGTLTRLLLERAMADHDEQEELVADSGLDWTILRPTGLTNGPPTGTWRAYERSRPEKLRGTIARADLAQLMLDCLTDASASGKALGVSR